MMRELVEKTRTYRRFKQNEQIGLDLLRGLVDAARLTASGANLQPLKYMVSNAPERNALIFPELAWAGYLQDWDGPAEGERPAAYIIILGDKDIRDGFECDTGIAAQTICLAAAEQGIGACMIGSIKREKLRTALDIPERFEIALVIALGIPGEQVVLEETNESGSIEYYRDATGVHHVPKRPLREVLLQ
jgi:nitroreductase